MIAKKAIIISMIMAFSVIIAVSTVTAFPALKSAYIVPGENIEVTVSQMFVSRRDEYRKDSVSLGFGLTPASVLSFRFELLNDSYLISDNSEPGDVFLLFRLTVAEYSAGFIRLFYFADIRFPSGDNAYRNPRWRRLSFGNDEVDTGFIMQMRPSPVIFLQGHLSYSFIARDSENFYSYLRLNPFEKNTYTSLFGFNPLAGDTFTSADNLINDFFSMSISLRTELFYPVMPSMELYKSFKTTKKNFENSGLEIEGCALEPFIIRPALAYFFSADIYVSLLFFYDFFAEYTDFYGIMLSGGFRF